MSGAQTKTFPLSPPLTPDVDQLPTSSAGVTINDSCAASSATAASSSESTATEPTPATEPATSTKASSTAQTVNVGSSSSSSSKQMASAAPKKQRKQLMNAPQPQNLEKPLTLECATPDSVPFHLMQLMTKLEEQQRKLSSIEVLTCLIYLIALESGFVEEETFKNKQHLLKPVPSYSSFHASNLRVITLEPVVYSIQFDDTVYRMILRTLLSERVPQEAAVVEASRTRLMIVILGDQLMVTISPMPPSKQRGYSISLSIGRYVLSVQSKSKSIYYRLKKLDELSLQLKERVFQPMRSQQFIEFEQYCHPSLVGMPDGVYEEIFRHLNRNQLNIVANVNRHLYFCSKQQQERRGGKSATV